MTSDLKTIACVLYPGVDPLDLIGPMQALGLLAYLQPNWQVVTVAERIEAIATEGPLLFTPSHSFDQVPTPQVLVVPGAATPAFRAMTDETLLQYLRTAAAQAEITASVCSGSLILGAAGLLNSRKATTHWTAFDLLAEFGAIPVRQRWVHDGAFITAAGQSAGIDMGLYLIEQLAGAEIARLTQFGMEYDPKPHLGPLDWDQAPYEFFDPLAVTWVEDGLTNNPDLAARLVARLRAGVEARAKKRSAHDGRRVAGRTPAAQKRAGPGGQLGASLYSRASGFHPFAGSLDQSLPNPSCDR